MFRQLLATPRRFALVAVVAFGLLSLVATPSTFARSTPKTSAAPLNAQMQRIVELVNQQRRQAGLAPVSVNPTLMSCAQQYSSVQAGMGRLSHTGPDGSTPGQRLRRCGYNWRHFGENLAAGYVNADEVVAAWMASPGHRKNILNPRVREIGLGYTNRADDPNYYYDYYVMELGIRR
jgi:uncharacterized protein YkwD